MEDWLSKSSADFSLAASTSVALADAVLDVVAAAVVSVSAGAPSAGAVSVGLALAEVVSAGPVDSLGAFSLGALSLLWLVPWLTGPARTLSLRRVEAARDESSPSFFDIIARREAIGAALGHFSANYTFYFVLSWLPYYLVNVRGYSLERMAAVGGLTYAMNAVSSWAAGQVGDRLIERGESPHRVYVTTMVTSHIAVAVCLVGVLLGGPRLLEVSLLATGLAFGLATPTLYAVGQLLAGPNAAGRWIGFQGAVGNLAGIVGPAITGFLVDRTGSFYSAFVLAIGFSLLGVLAWTIVIPRIAEVRWGIAATT